MATKLFFPFEETLYNNIIYVKIILKHFCKKNYVVQGINNTSRVDIGFDIGLRGKPFASIDEVHRKANIIIRNKINTRKACLSYLLFSLNQLLFLFPFQTFCYSLQKKWFFRKLNLIEMFTLANEDGCFD